MKPYLPAARLTCDAARAAVDAALVRAAALGVAVSVAVVDSGGHPLVCARMDGALLHGFDIAGDKAFTAAATGAPTAAVAAYVAAQPEAVRRMLESRPRLVTAAGGFPIRGDGLLLGAIGVSGGTEEQDADCATAGMAALDLGGNPPESQS